MIRHQIHDQLHTPGMERCDQRIHIFHGAKLIHDIPVIWNVIAIIIVRAFIAGAYPDSVHAQIFQIIQFLNDPLQITNTIAIAVHKAAGINLINHPAKLLLIFFAKHPFFLLLFIQQKYDRFLPGFAGRKLFNPFCLPVELEKTPPSVVIAHIRVPQQTGIMLYCI